MPYQSYVYHAPGGLTPLGQVWGLPASVVGLDAR